jgi:endonuclease/exonuclease/phosphatase (EEP) superfamily protein YafD
VVVLLLIAVLFIVFATLRLSGIDGNRYTACALALTPYGVVGGVVLGGLAVAVGQRWTGGIVLASAVVLAARVLPRAIPSARPRVAGCRLRVMSSNLYLGRGDVKTVVQLVREHQVDVLNLLELTADAAEDFARAGLFDLLPHRVLRPADGGAGSGVVSRYPLVELALAGPSRLAQPSARVDLGGVGVEVVAVHPVPPTDSAAVWKAEMAGLPGPVADGPVRVLAGDFNATTDHGTFRRLLRAGYVDVGERCGAGLVATWPSRMFPLLVTLDHVLVDDRASVTAYRVFDVPYSDHKAVYAELVVPEAITTSVGNAREAAADLLTREEGMATRLADEDRSGPA